MSLPQPRPRSGRHRKARLPRHRALPLRGPATLTRMPAHRNAVGPDLFTRIILAGLQGAWL